MLDNENRNRMCTSCCFKCDKRMVVYITQCLFGAFTIAFSAYQLHYEKTCEGQQPYISFFTFVLGVFLQKEIINKI